jgi:DHA1 family multidrug resistance protein-like MFS transporter
MEDIVSGPRPGAANWQSLLFAVCIAQAVAIMGFDFALPFMPLYLQRDLGVHGLGQVALWSGLIGFGPAIPATIFGPLWGRLADRFGYRTMLLRAMACAAILLALMGLVPSPGVLLVLRMVQGALTGTVFAAQALVATSVPKEETGRSMGLLQMSVFLGATLGPVAGGTVATLLDYRASYVSAGVLLGLATIVVVFFVREPERRVEVRTVDGKDRSSMLAVMAVPAFAAVLGLTLIVQLAATALLPAIPLFVQDLLHSARNVPSDTGWLLAVSGLAAGVGSYLTGQLSKHLSVKPLIAGCLLLSALLFVPQAFSANYTEFLIVRSLGSFAFGGMTGLVGTLAALSSPSNAKGTAFGLMGSASSLGFGGGPLLGGAIVAAFGIRSVFLFSAGMLLIMPVLLITGAFIASKIFSARRGVSYEV